MEHWDHTTCRGMEELGSNAAVLMSGLVIGVCMFCGYALGLI